VQQAYAAVAQKKTRYAIKRKTDRAGARSASNWPALRGGYASNLL